ncbi:MAG: hypothetical protein C0P67_014185 [Bacillota bacterium]
MGRPYLKVTQEAVEGIRQITDVDRPDVRNFWRTSFGWKSMLNESGFCPIR